MYEALSQLLVRYLDHDIIVRIAPDSEVALCRQPTVSFSLLSVDCEPQE